MTLTNMQALGIVLAVTLGTMITRFLPFVLFPDSKPVPKIVEYLGRTLPAATMAPRPIWLFISRVHPDAIQQSSSMVMVDCSSPAWVVVWK